MTFLWTQQITVALHSPGFHPCSRECILNPAARGALARTWWVASTSGGPHLTENGGCHPDKAYKALPDLALCFFPRLPAQPLLFTPSCSWHPHRHIELWVLGKLLNLPVPRFPHRKKMETLRVTELPEPKVARRLCSEKTCCSLLQPHASPGPRTRSNGILHTPFHTVSWVRQTPEFPAQATSNPSAFRASRASPLVCPRRHSQQGEWPVKALVAQSCPTLFWPHGL